MGTKRLFAADLGASGGKCFVGTFNDGLFSLQEIHRFDHEGVSFYIADKTGKTVERSYWDDISIYRNIVAGLHNYRRDISDTLDSIGIDTWGTDGQFMTKDGDMLGKVYCYRDHRLDNMIATVKSRIDARRIYEITGIHFQPFNLSNQLHWFALKRKQLLRRSSFFLPVPTLFYYYLGGVKKVDSSWASVTQLMDAKKKKWSTEIFRALGVPKKVMPEIVEPGAIMGKMLEPLSRSIGINQAALVAAPAHDTACAFAAAPVDNTDDALIISSGTWSLVGKLAPTAITSEAAMAANISNEGGVGNVRLLKNCMGTWLVQELRRAWRVADGREMAWDELTRLASSAAAFGSLIDPDNPGFFNPPNMETAIADFCRRTGQPVPADRKAFLRTVYESLALKYRMVNEQICAISGKKSKVVHIVGGGSKNAMLNQFTADALGLPVVAGPEEATAVGNLMVQAMGLGIIGSVRDSLPLIRQAFPIKTYTPQATEEWRQAYERFVKIAS